MPQSLFKLQRLALVTTCVAGLTACANKPSSKITLLPNSDGRATSVLVSTSKGSQVLDKPYQVVLADPKQNLTRGQTDAESVKQHHLDLIRLTPAEPLRFVLYFESGESRLAPESLTPESLALLPQMIEQARRRSGGEIVVIGHTDRQDTSDANDRLSLQRASAVRNLFVIQGFDPSLIEASGRGEREPLVPTDDEVAEPRNRRAEIIVR